MADNWLIVMVKEPRPGRVKTRLGRDIGYSVATWWFRHQVRHVLRRLRDPRWQIVLAVSPDHLGMQSRFWPTDLPRVPQGAGDLGDRMARVMGAMPPGKVCVIGADIPGVKRPHIWKAFQTLGQSEVTFGPAPDGGFWLVGLRNSSRVPAGIFKGARWSSCHALADSIASLKGLSLSLVDQLDDVDTIEDLKRLQAHD